MKQKFLPLGGMNLSSSLGLVPPTDYTASFNCHISNDSEGKAGAITNIVGNVPTTIPFLEDASLNPYRAFYPQSELNFVVPHTINGETSVKLWEDFLHDGVGGRVLGQYEEPSKRRIYYFIGWDGFEYTTKGGGLESPTRYHSGTLMLVCFEQHETIEDYFILQQNGSIIITQDGDFLITEESENGDLLGTTQVVGWWGFGDSTFKWDDRFVITGVGKTGNDMHWAMGDVFDPMTINVERGLLTYQSAYNSEYELDNEEYIQIERYALGDTYFRDTVDNACDQDYLNCFFNPSEFTFIKRGGLRPPTLVAELDESMPKLLGRDILQFAYRYVYKNGYRSVVSPYSEKVRQFSKNSDAYINKVTVSLPETEFVPDDVDKVEICVRHGRFDADSVWLVFDSVDVADAILDVQTRTLDYNTPYGANRVGEMIDQVSGTRLFDAVPLRSQALEVGSNQRVFMGNVIPAGSYTVDDNDFVVIFEEGATQITTVEIRGFYRHFERILTGTDGQGVVSVSNMFFVIVNSSDFSGYNGAYKLSGISITDYDNNALPDFLSISPSSVTVPWANQVLTDQEIWDEIASFYDDGGGGNSSGGYEVIVLEGSDLNTQDPLMTEFGTSSGGGVQFKSGSSYQLGIVPFDDKGRTMGVITNKEWVIDVDERTYDSVDTFTNIKATFVDAPNWVNHFTFVRTKSLNIHSFVQFKGDGDESVKYAKSKRVDDVTGYALLPTGTLDVTPSAEYLAVSLKGLNDLGSGFEYDPEQDIVVRIVDETQEIEVTPIATHVDSGDEIWLICTIAEFVCSSDSSNQPIIEIRTLKGASDSPVFYETSAWGFDGNAGQQFTLAGDVHLKAPNGVLVECQNTEFDRHYYLDYSLGRPLVAAPDQKQKRLGDRIYYSGAATPDSERTFINSVSALDYKDTSDNGGDIQVLKMTSTTDIYGQVMLAIAETNTTSLYLGETLVRGKDGNMQTTASDKVIGGTSELRGMYGTSHPQSVAAYQGSVCWFDVNKGAVVHYGSGGIKVISDNGLSNYFRTMSDFVRPLNLASSINKRYNQYYITIGEDSARPVRTLAGYTPEEGEPDNPFELADGFVLVYDMDTERWTTAITMNPECLGGIGTLPMSFKDGRLWIHKSGSRNKFFGENYPSKIAVVLNAPPNDVKIPESISIEADEAPSHIYIQNLRPYLQQTDIDSTEFVEKEGIYYAPVLRDRLSNGGLEDDYLTNLLSGEKIRGQYIQIAVVMDYPDDDFEINAINVNYTISSGHTVGKPNK